MIKDTFVFYNFNYSKTFQSRIGVNKKMRRVVDIRATRAGNCSNIKAIRGTPTNVKIIILFSQFSYYSTTRVMERHRQTFKQAAGIKNPRFELMER